ncbi:glutamate racemase [Natronocella acetinitrilica]|uniref:Glutamate racemase n=1 Tax=Natronocella acetinitrilica TaxID=414046 RepID=A0AAE3KBV4_9GAMM|nr:glutamate racemase [Natronocella acetinitrilica]
MPHQPDATAPIGLFDSGLGGLSVLREVRALLPAESLLYVADSAYAPYGSRSAAEVLARSRWLTAQLVESGAKAVVIACNTATAVAADALRAEFPIPVIAMEPAIKPAAAATRNGVIGVLATEGTLASVRFAALLDRYADGLEVITQPCPGLVEAIERNQFDDQRIGALLDRYLAPLQAAGADTIILGCTHYPFLRQQIAARLAPEIVLIDTGAAVARQLNRRLQDLGTLRPPQDETPHAARELRLATTGDITLLQAFAEREGLCADSIECLAYA